MRRLYVASVLGAMLALVAMAGVGAARDIRDGDRLVAVAAGERAGGSKTDITETAEGETLISESVKELQRTGHAYAPSDLIAVRYGDGDAIVGPRLLGVVDLRKEGAGYRATVTAVEQPILVAAVGPITAAAPYWSPVSDNCWILWRSTSHFDVCYRMYWMANDGIAGKDYWRLDMYGTMFTGTGRTADWGWLTMDQDAGPAQSYVSWDPTSDSAVGGCLSEILTGTVLGVQYGWNYSHCELWNISKSGTTTLGYFKNEWSWAGVTPKKNADRGVALTVTTKGNSGSPTFGLSWNFAEH